MARHLGGRPPGRLPEADGKQLLAARQGTKTLGAAGGGDEAEEGEPLVIIVRNIHALDLKR